MTRQPISRRLSWLTLPPLLLGLGGCGSFVEPDSGPAHSMYLDDTPDVIPRWEPRSASGNPPSYTVLGKSYQVRDQPAGYTERGIASWYGRKFHGRKTSSGEIYNMYDMTAAHKTLPLPTYLEVTNLDNGRHTVVRVNDRGPFKEGRVIDLSYAAASKLGVVETGTAQVEIRVITADGPAPPVTTAAARRPPPAVNAAVYVQVGAFADRDNAETMRKQLAEENIRPVVIQSASSNARQVFRVRIGPLRNSEEADTIADKVARLGFGIPKIVAD